MQRIKSEDSIKDTLKEISVGSGEKLRESEKRENNLRKFAQLRSRNPKTNLNLRKTKTAFVEVDEDSNEFRDITITSEKFKQVTTDFPDDYHDYLIQKAMCVHEVAHILYSSYPAMEKYTDKVHKENGEKYVILFKNFFNAIEDGAIEKFASENFRVEEELYHLRQTIHERYYMGEQLKDGQYRYPFFFAVMTACINIGVYDNGELGKILDDDNDDFKVEDRGTGLDKELFEELLPKIRDHIQEIQSEYDAEKRTELCYELWQEVVKYLDRSTTPGKSEAARNDIIREADNYIEGVPENLSPSHGKQEEEPIDSEENDEGEGGSGVTEEARTGEEERKKKAKQGIIEESKNEDSDWEDELEEIMQSLGGDGVDEIYIPDDEPVNTQRKRKAKRHGKRAAKIFQNRLKRQQRDETISGKRRGKLDSTKMIRGERGSTNIYQQTIEKGDKNYNCMIVCDRSGSMADRVEEVELAAGSIAYGLESVGVDTCLLDTYNSKTTLAKPFQSDVSSFEEKMFTGRYGGGTPLRHTLKFANQRICRGKNDVPFMIVITDGRPNDNSATKNEIKKANFPVIGLHLTDSVHYEDQLTIYDRADTIGSNESVGKKLINIINSIVF